MGAKILIKRIVEWNKLDLTRNFVTSERSRKVKSS